MENKSSKEFNLYKDIQGRTGGEIYIGVVGPVRTGKSTFIKRFMDLCVLPYMTDAAKRERTIDELPQSAQGRTIMTTEPKFIPQEAATIELLDQSSIKVRLIDCVGYMVEGASGHLEGEGERMVKTPWFPEEIPFTEAAKIGTQKVIHDHATIGIVVTTDGSIGELPRQNYLEAEQTTIRQLKEIGKPYIILLNCERPYSEETTKLRDEMEAQYGAVVIPVNCKQLRSDDMLGILESILMEFPVDQIKYYIPKWTEMLAIDHPVKQALITAARQLLGSLTHMRDVEKRVWEKTEDGDNSRPQDVARQQGNGGKMTGPADSPIEKIRLLDIDLSDGSVSFAMEVKECYYYENISDMAGVKINGEYEMISMIRELSGMKNEYEKVRDAMESVEQKGYGVVMPQLADISMENPVLIQHGSKYGVKMKAMSPSIHLIKANIETEIAPIVGSREQAEDLIAYIQAGEQEGEVWNTNIFGKSVGELMEDGIRSKIQKMDDECQMKLQETMQKIVNESNGGLICLII